jgi:hypothetical protein
MARISGRRGEGVFHALTVLIDAAIFDNGLWASIDR